MMFGNSLAEEYMLLVEKKGFTLAEIKELVLGGIEMSWMPEERKRQMLTTFDRDPIWFDHVERGYSARGAKSAFSSE